VGLWDPISVSFLVHIFGADLIEVRALGRDPSLLSCFRFNKKHSEMVCPLFLQYVEVGGYKGLKSLLTLFGLA
jgi:hypothetical protein